MLSIGIIAVYTPISYGIYGTPSSIYGTTLMLSYIYDASYIYVTAYTGTSAIYTASSIVINPPASGSLPEGPWVYLVTPSHNSFI